jgi:hypothetical protein
MLTSRSCILSLAVIAAVAGPSWADDTATPASPATPPAQSAAPAAAQP